MEYESNYLEQPEKVVYSDSETVIYEYDCGRQVRKIGAIVKIFTKEEAEIWMRSKSVDLAEYNLIQSEQIPNDSGRKNYISKEISNLKYGKECLLYINEYGIWPSSENMDLFNGYRKSIGVNESLLEKPAHLIDVSENKELYCLLCMVLYFGWGALLIPENTNEMIRISHDEYIEVLAKGDISKRNTFASEFSSIYLRGQLI